MFPSPQERRTLDRMHRDLWSGSGPKQFGLELQRNQEIIDQAIFLRAESGSRKSQFAAVFRRRIKSWVRAKVAAMSLTPKAR